MSKIYRYHWRASLELELLHVYSSSRIFKGLCILDLCLYIYNTVEARYTGYAVPDNFAIYQVIALLC